MSIIAEVKKKIDGFLLRDGIPMRIYFKLKINMMIRINDFMENY